MPSKPPQETLEQELARRGAPTSVTDPLPREKLSPDLQSLIDRQDNFLDNLYDGSLNDSTDTSFRYAAYATRIRTIMLSAHRYVAYTSDIGESFRPVAHPYLVKSAYGISWLYLIGDVSNESWKAYKRNQKLLAPASDEHMQALEGTAGGTKQPLVQNATDSAQKQKPEQSQPLTNENLKHQSFVQSGAVLQDGSVNTAVVRIPAIEDWKAVAAQRAVFQSVASMGLPAFTIHSIVRYSGKALKNAKNTTVRTWGPIGVSCLAFSSVWVVLLFSAYGKLQ